ncbi:ankyrin repeat containing protein [Coccidioides posadasii C735 delta SOWgp]|uniref:Ankyrin repeat containing protein n=1 Tax=Coccidioides posadasii (strain C735) TaxID=222929 RepID=C5P4A6_COCP7|nr:ankyrin repeat containing protein [Coccidioides posadasii C735 delta SOWgp]EER28524.1 ankyrin repeat containing protein [Coccidioides posadasii C735 delta SOWgp]|eukprot:XP_003070669.1 ankyrin repeat containing protein [Coccidioides posadasii C735 delta SOWgp]
MHVSRRQFPLPQGLHRLTMASLGPICWDNYKDILEDLYLHQNMSLKEVRTTMIPKGLEATECQYEAQFKEWGFRKKLKKEEWRIVGYKTLKRKREQKETEMLLNKRVICPKKFKRQCSRYMRLSEMTGITNEGPPPKTPDGVKLRTPQTEAAPQELALIQSPALTVDPLTIQACSKGLDQSVQEKRSLGLINQAMEAMNPAHRSQTAVEEAFRLFVYLAANKLINIDDEKYEALYGQLRSYFPPAAWKCMFSIRSPAVEALAESLFPLAVKAGDAVTVQEILQHTTIDPDTRIDLPDLQTPRIDFLDLPPPRIGLTNLQTPLQFACTQGFLELVRVLLDARADVNKFPALSCALRVRFAGGHGAALVKILLQAGANVNPATGDFPLSVAAANGDALAVSLLLDAGANVNPLFKTPPLVHALRSSLNNVENVTAVVFQLLEAGAMIDGPMWNVDLPEEEDNWDTMLELAAELNGDIEVISLLMEYGAPVSDGLMEIASSYGDIDVLQLLLERGVRPPRKLDYLTEEMAKLFMKYEPWNSVQALIYAAYTGDNDLIKSVFEAGAPVTPSALERMIGEVDNAMVIAFLNAAADERKQDCFKAVLCKAILVKDAGLIEALHALEGEFELHSAFRLDAKFRHAAQENCVGLFRALIGPKSRFRPNAIEHLKGSLIEAILRESRDVIEILLRTCPIEILGDGPHLLAAAIKKRNTELFHHLLRSGVAVNEIKQQGLKGEDVEHRTVLSEAVDTGDFLIIRELIYAGADLNAKGLYSDRTPLSLAVENGDVAIINILIEAGADINAPHAMLSGSSALFEAVWKGSLLLVQKLLDHGANIDETALVAAVFRPTSILLLLLQTHQARYRIIPHGYGCEALQLAITDNQRDKTEALLKFGVQVNWIARAKPGLKGYSFLEAKLHYGLSALGVAVEGMGHIDPFIVTLILNSPNLKINALAKTQPSRTGLDLAIEQNSVLAVGELIKLGADVNKAATQDLRRTPLQLAAETSSFDIVQLLLHHGAKVNAPAFITYGATVLQLASIRGNIEMAQLLLEAGAEVNALPAEVGGRTAIEGAAEHGRIDMVMFLLMSGADIMSSGRVQYKRAREFALQNGHLAICRLLDTFADPQDAGI